jgi:predicted outer membrane lipoprotein
MAYYGAKRGVKAPGEWRFTDLFGLSLASAAGIIVALITEFQQKQEASALFTINKWLVGLGELLGYQNVFPLWSVALLLAAIGAASVFYFQPVTRQGAFAQGFGLLAVIMTSIPDDLAGGLEAAAVAAAPEAEVIQEVNAQPWAQPRAIRASYVQNGAAELLQIQDALSQSYNILLTINYPNGLNADMDSLIRQGDMRGRLHNEDTGQTWDLFRRAGGTVSRQGNSLIIRTGLPAMSQTAKIWVRIETAGYAIEQQSATASMGETLQWTVNMRQSSVPLFVQRLNTTYRF